MSVLRRITRLFKADLHGILDCLEEPEAILRQAMRDMEDEIEKEIAEKNEEIIIKDGDADTKKLKKITINHELKKDFIDAKEETLKINHFINEQSLFFKRVEML